MLFRIKNICLYIIGVVVVGSNLVNYFYAYKHLGDNVLQWRIAMYSIAIVLFLFSLYAWITEIGKKGQALKLVFVGWMTIYLLINLIGVCLGYNLHSKGFMVMLFLAMLCGMAHICIRLWQKYY